MWSALSLWIAATGLREEMYTECSSETLPNLPTGATGPVCYDTVAIGQNTWRNEDPMISPASLKHLGTLDSILQITNLKYVKENHGIGGWDLRLEELALRNQPDEQRGQGTASACYEGSHYLCPPGPCTVLDINYLADVNYYKPGHKNNRGQELVAGRSYCGAAFGVQMQFLNDYTSPDGLLSVRKGTVYPPPDKSRRTLAYLRGNAPDKVQSYIPQNDQVNRIPAWWYKTYEDWQTNGDMRTNGLRCSDRAVPRWMVPSPGISGGEDPDAFKDVENKWYGNYAGAKDRKIDASFHKTVLRASKSSDTPSDPVMHEEPCEQKFGHHRETEFHGHSAHSFLSGCATAPTTRKDSEHPRSARPNEPYPGSWHGSGAGAFTLCDSSVLAGVFLGISTRHHRDLQKGRRLSRLFDGDTSKNAHGIYKALKHYLESSTPCRLEAGCDLMSLIRPDLNSSTPEEKTRALHALFLGQIATVLRPCESPHTKQAKVKGATYNHWRKAHYNPGQNRAAVERIVLGCDPDNPWMLEHCAAVRGKHQWTASSSCVGQGKCTASGDTCCNAVHEPVVDVDTSKPDDLRAHYFTSYYCTDVGINSDDLDSSVWFELFHTTTKHGARNAWKKKLKRGRSGKAGKDLIQHEKKCGMIMSFDPKLKAFVSSDPAFNSSKFYVRNRQERKDDTNLLKGGTKAVLVKGAAFMAGLPTIGLGLLARFATNKKESISQLVGATAAYGDIKAVTYAGNLQRTCNAKALSRFFTILSSCVAYAVPYLRKEYPSLTIANIKNQIEGHDRENNSPVCAILGVAIGDCTGSLCQCTEHGDETTKVSKYNCQATSAYEICKAYEAAHPENSIATQSGVTWKTALDRALAGPRMRYMLPANYDHLNQPLDSGIYELAEFASDSARSKSLFDEFWYESGEDSARLQTIGKIRIRGNKDNEGITHRVKKRNANGTLTPPGEGTRIRHTFRTMQMRPLARFPERSFLPGRIAALGRAAVEGAGSAEGELSMANKCDHYHDPIEQCSGAGADAFYVFPSTASDNETSPAVGPNARGQVCTARFRIADFLAINAYVSNYNTGPTDTTRMFPPIDWHLGDKFQNLGESCFGSMQSTKQTEYCGWDEANVRAIFNIDESTTLPTFHHHTGMNLFASSQRSTSRDTNREQPNDHLAGYMQFLGKPWSEIAESDDDWNDLLDTNSNNKPKPMNMAPNNNGIFDTTGYIEACVGEHASAAEISWYNMPTKHPTLTSAVYACEALRMQGCVGVQRFAVDHYEVRSRGQAEQLTHIGSNGACDRFYLVPCLGVETCNDLFGCREDSGVRRNAGRDEPSFSGPNPGEPPVKYDVGADESYFLDGLSMYTANTRFSLNPLAFEGGRSDLDPNELAEGSEALKYDFNYSHWVFSQEIPFAYNKFDGESGDQKLSTFKAAPKKVRMVTTPGYGLGLPHTNGIRHVPKREGREQSKLFAFSWGGMFDAQEYIHGSGQYRFRHPSADPPEKHPGMFPMVGDGLNISFMFDEEEWNFLLDDSFVRAMTSKILDVRTEEGFEEWKELFWKNQRCPMTKTDGGFVEENTDETWGGLWYNIMYEDPAKKYSGQNCQYMGGSVTLGGYIDPSNKVGVTKEEENWNAYQILSGNMSFSDKFSSHFETTHTGVIDPADNFDEFTEAYEGICDLHACDIVQDHQDDAMRADNMMFSHDFTAFRGKDKKSEDLFVRQRNGIGHQYASHVRRAFSCIGTNLTEFHRGRSLVDLQNNGDTWNSTTESYARSAFGLLGFKAVAIERAVLSGMIRAVANRYFQISNFDKKAQWEKVLPELESVCTDFLSESGVDMGIRSCNIRAKSWEQVLPGAMGLDGIPTLSLLSESTPHFRPGVNAAGFGLGNLQYGKHFASIELQKMRSLPGSAFYDTRRSLDYNGIDTHKLYDEHRDAIPVRDILRSATFTNRQDQAEATPCDCDNQEIVWACERIGGEDTRLVTFVRPDFGAGPKPTGAFADRFGSDFGDSAAIFECGYSWKQPPMRTPKIGLYVPSKVDVLEIYERDIFDGGVVPDFECDPNAVENITDYEDCGQDDLQRLHNAERDYGKKCPEGDEDDLECTFLEKKEDGKVISLASVNTSDLINCSRSHSGVECTRQTASLQSARQCAAAIFSTPMGPHPPKLREMLFTGLHPHPRARYDVNEISSYGHGRVGAAGLTEDEETLIKSSGKASCYTRQNLYVYAGACLRWPFGASHLHTIGHGQHDETTAYWLNRITASQCESPPCPGTANFTKNSKSYTEAIDMTGDIAWQGYCELEHERHQFNPEDYSLYDDGRSGKYRYCANDPLSYRQRDTLCRTMAPHFVMYAWGLTIRKPTDVCNSVTKVCLLVPGYPGSGSLSRMLDDPDVGPFAGYTILISPFHKEVVENYYSDRALFEVGNSYARTSGPNSGRRPTLENMPLKHPLHLTRREDVNYSNADAVLPEDHIEYTHMAGSGTVLAMMAKMPAVTAEEAITIFDTLVRHVENTCRFDSRYASFTNPTSADRAPTIPDDDAFESALCSTYSLTTAQRQAFGTYFLPAELHSRNIKGVRWEDVYKVIPADFAIVDAPQVTIRSAARHHPLRYGPDPFKPRRKSGSTCTRFVVAAPGFTLLNAEFNQTGCGGLTAAAQTPIRFVGTDARHATVEATAIYTADQDAVVGAVVLGGDHSLVFSGGSTAVDGMYLNMSMYGERNGERVGPSEGTFSTYFQLGLADGTGTVRFAPPTCAASAGCANLSTTIIQQLGQNKSETVRYKCADAPGAPTDLALYEYPPGGCRVLDVGAITQVFGSGYEAGIYHRDPSTVNHEYAILIGLSLLVLALLLINCGLTISGDKAAHRALGLMGPMPDAALYEALKSAEINSEEILRRPRAATAASFSHFGVPRRRGVVSDPPSADGKVAEWTTVPATARKGTLWQRHAGVGVQVQVGKTIYDAEALLDPAFDLSLLPPTLQSTAVALRKSLMAEHTK